MNAVHAVDAVDAVEMVASGPPWQPAEWARCIGRLPSLPSAFIEAVTVLSQDDAPASACIEVIERDQALAVQVLRLANSAFYGAPGQVARISDAVQMLGLRTVASTLAAMTLRTTLDPLRCEGFCFDSYWRHTLCSALSAREVAKLASLDAGEAFLLGLLHDVGQLILAMTNPALQAQALQRCRVEGVSLHDAELQVFGLSHADVGAAVARQWNFPARISAAIASHHTPAQPGDRLVFANLLQFVNPLAHDVATPTHHGTALLANPVWSALGMSEPQLCDLTHRISEELEVMTRV